MRAPVICVATLMLAFAVAPAIAEDCPAPSVSASPERVRPGDRVTVEAEHFGGCGGGSCQGREEGHARVLLVQGDGTRPIGSMELDGRTAPSGRLRFRLPGRDASGDLWKAGPLSVVVIPDEGEPLATQVRLRLR